MFPFQCYAIKYNTLYKSSFSRLLTFPLARVYQHTSAISIFWTRGYPNILRKESEAVPEGIGPVPRQEFRPDQPTLVDLYRLLKEGFERERKQNKSLLDKIDVLSRKMNEISEDWRSMHA